MSCFNERIELYSISNMHFITLFILYCIDFPPFMLIPMPLCFSNIILACRHGNMHKRCIRFSNKKKRGGIGVREACVLCLHPHSDLSNKAALLPPPPTFSNQISVSQDSVSCLLPAPSQRFSSRLCYNKERLTLE